MKAVCNMQPKCYRQVHLHDSSVFCMAYACMPSCTLQATTVLYLAMPSKFLMIMPTWGWPVRLTLNSW